MNNPERIEALTRFGYDADEARFLAIAALHGGYFLRRQFLAFMGGTKGWKDVLLLKKLTDKEHARTLVYRHERMAYHLSAKPLYDALGEPDNRNRREHQPATVKNKIMGLDFVLEHPAYDYLATEREKLDYFVRAQNTTPDDLPTRWYASPRGGDSKPKHFVESCPIFVTAPIEGTALRPHFCYIDEGLQTTDRFATYLKQYGRLFAAIGDFHVIYVAEHPRLFASAERIFQRFADAFLLAHNPVDPEHERLLAYFQRRLLYDNQDFSDFDTAALIRFREDKKRFAGEEYDDRYTRWKAVPIAGLAVHGSAAKQFSTYLLEHNYDLFGTLTHESNKRRNSENQTDPSTEWFGAESGRGRGEPLDGKE